MANEKFKCRASVEAGLQIARSHGEFVEIS